MTSKLVMYHERTERTPVQTVLCQEVWARVGEPKPGRGA